MPDSSSKESALLLDYYKAHSDDPEIMFWSSVAQSFGMINTGRSPNELILEAAKKGNTSARAQLGAWLLTGENVPKDVDRGLNLLESLQDEDSIAALNLGEACLYGTGVTIDYVRSEKLLRKAIDLGNVRAHKPLAVLFEKLGRENDVLAELRAGAEGGEEACMIGYAQALEKGKYGVKPDLHAAIDWWFKAAERRIPLAQREMAKAILNGTGGLPRSAKNLERARGYLASAAQANDAEAIYYLGRCYLTTDLETEYRPQQAIELLTRAAAMNVPGANLDIGILTIEGLVVPRDLVQARKYLERAQDLGAPGAKSVLLRLETASTQPASPAPASH